MKESRETNERAESNSTTSALEAQSFDDFARRVHDLDWTSLTAGQLDGLARHLHALPGDADIEIALLGNITLDLLPRSLDVLAASLGLRTACWVAPFDQHEQQLLDPQSELRRRDPDLVFLVAELWAALPALSLGFSGLSDEERGALRTEALDRTVGWAERAADTLTGHIAVANFPRPVSPAAGLAEAHADGETEFYLRLHLEMLERLRDASRAHLIDLERLVLKVGADHGRDTRMELMARLPWTDAFSRQVTAELVRVLAAVKGRTAKCLVLDLDGTLWGGVVGEDGTHGVAIGQGDARGEAYERFQRRLRTLMDRGLILAVCSKNNPDDALAVFKERSEMVLREEDIAAFEIGWGPKYEAIQRIGDALDLGLDSFVFFDDNPAEIALVREALPEVRCVPLPRDPSAFIAVLERRLDLDPLAILDSDRSKTQQYREQGLRKQSRTRFDDLGTYLAGLDTRLTIRSASTADIPRIHQLFTKTNQFNVTTIRYDLGEVEKLVASDRHRFDLFTVDDRFGRLGTVGLVLREEDHIDSFILSCRALGRGVETAMMNHVKRAELLDGARDHLTAKHIETQRNAVSSTFFDEQGFALLGHADGVREYRLDRSSTEEIGCDWIEVVGA